MRKISFLLIMWATTLATINHAMDRPVWHQIKRACSILSFITPLDNHEDEILILKSGMITGAVAASYISNAILSSNFKKAEPFFFFGSANLVITCYIFAFFICATKKPDDPVFPW